jgi:hypothetical protein
MHLIQTVHKNGCKIEYIKLQVKSPKDTQSEKIYPSDSILKVRTETEDEKS